MEGIEYDMVRKSRQSSGHNGPMHSACIEKLQGQVCDSRVQGLCGCAHLLIAVREVHEAVVVVVVVGPLGGIGGQQQVVGAQAVALRVRVRKDARLQQLVVRVPDACAIHRQRQI